MTPGSVSVACRTDWSPMTTLSTTAPRLPWNPANPYPFMNNAAAKVTSSGMKPPKPGSF